MSALHEGTLPLLPASPTSALLVCTAERLSYSQASASWRGKNCYHEFSLPEQVWHFNLMCTAPKCNQIVHLQHTKHTMCQRLYLFLWRHMCQGRLLGAWEREASTVAILASLDCASSSFNCWRYSHKQIVSQGSLAKTQLQDKPRRTSAAAVVDVPLVAL